MKKIILNFTLFGAATFLLLGCAALKSTNSSLDFIQASVDLVAINDDKVQVEITPPKIQSEEITFYIPQIVPGTYEYSNFGRFIENLQAYDSKGNLLDFEALDENSWKISNAKKLAKITYWANDTFDGPGGSEIYPMGGTNFQEGETFLLNLHSLIGYFEGMKETSYRLSVRSPKDLKGFTSLPALSQTDSLDVFTAKRYFHIIDNPILYSKPNAVSFDLDKIKVGLALYSPSGVHKADAYQPAIEEMMVAQKNFLGEANNTPSYDILLHLMGMEDLQYFGGMMGALEHHTSTTVVFVDQMQPQELTQSLVDVVSHEFFHTLTPLNIHSEEIHNFEYNTPMMSQHLWMYEGTTEYFANLFQINQGLIEEQNFYNRILEKINYSQRYDDTMSFTEMSAGIVEEPYQSNYGNVYQKGALINMCLDILIREKSGGEKGILWVMQNLAKRYGADKPFKDEELIDEIIAMTYPEVGDFFKIHVEGTQPINYEDYLSKVGLTRGETDIELPSILLKDSQSPFFMPQPNEEGTVQYVVTGLNSTIASMGVQEGDLFLGLDGTLFPEIKQENAEAINAIFTPTFMWDAQKEFSITVKRGEDLLALTGVTGTPTVKAKGIVANPQADPNAIALRQSWLKE
jgi:predicted metalloprotease with PDZ domain